MISHVLSRVGADPSYVIGGALTGASTGGHIGAGDAFVVEADESDGSFLQYPAEIAVVTNVDPDHLSNWGTAENYADGFLRFATGGSVRLLVISARRRAGAVALTERLRCPRGTAERPTRHLRRERERRRPDHRCHLRRHRVDLRPRRRADTAQRAGRVQRLERRGGVRGRAWISGADAAAVRAELETYGGTNRRFQLIGTVDDIRVYDDYAHHPTEVANTLRAARTGVGEGGRVVVCFQPHLFTRTRDFWRELAAALELADQAIVMDVCGDREDPIAGIDGRDGGGGRGPRDRDRHLRAGLGLGGARRRRDRPPGRPGDHGRVRRRDQGRAADRGRPAPGAGSLMKLHRKRGV